MSIRNLFFLGALIMMQAACSSDLFLVHNGNMPAAEKVAQIHKGQTREEVESILGSPSSTAIFDDESWIYMSSTVKKVAFFRPEEINRDILEIKFDRQGQVAEIIKLNKDNGTNLTVDSDKTVTAGHNIGFFRKYFGGVGTYMPVSPTKNDN